MIKEMQVAENGKRLDVSREFGHAAHRSAIITAKRGTSFTKWIGSIFGLRRVGGGIGSCARGGHR
jgi:hypothetical protein